MTMKKPKLNIVTLGCSKNKVDSERLAASLSHRYDIVHESEKKSDIVIINTCGFIGDAKEESIDTILEYAELRRAKKIKRLYVTGCLSQRYRKDLQEEIHEVDGFYGVESVQMIAKDILTQESADSETLRLCDSVSYNHERVLSTPEHYAYLKIAEGCDRRCSYCAIPLMTGGYRSRNQEDIINEAKYLISRGVKEIQLIAQDLTYYGMDKSGVSTIADLTKRLSDLDGLEWIRLHYAYPAAFPEDVIEVMAREKKICKYLDIPFQHISDNQLSAMKRRHTKEEALMLIKKLRTAIPDIALRTTLLVGYPTESDADFAELVEFVRETKFDRLGVFAYSEEEGTYSATRLSDDVPEQTKQERVDAIMRLQERISLENNAKRIGQKMRVIIDRKEGDFYIGRSEYDSPEVDQEIIVESFGKRLYRGRFYNVAITDAEDYDLYAEILL